ncbi:hypothetical protein VIGAN_05162700 [Vigna angularis var. angularis]|uniref:Protein FAR1-RELATED SEQUENCE n=1 Tax=Vigna angularis var. angularis TaxID=157739 RepID=A0A0S3S5U1_PHAAN|nr:hypothetical protein VIGAN_05162700 [Vigna angularis var. angularis]
MDWMMKMMKEDEALSSRSASTTILDLCLLSKCKSVSFHSLSHFKHNPKKCIFTRRESPLVGRVNDYFSIPEEYLPSRWRRESSLIPQSRHIINYNDNSSVEFRSLVQCLEVESLKIKDRVEVATKELKKVIHYLKGMPEVQENSIDLEHDVLNVDECDVENPITSKTKGRPRGSRAKGGVEAVKKSRHCHYPNCGRTDSRNCPIKKKKDSLLASQSSPNKLCMILLYSKVSLICNM